MAKKKGRKNKTEKSDGIVNANCVCVCVCF